MSQPYIGEIRMFAGSFAPAGWMTCDGQLIPISENDTLFNLIGTTYGGDGQNTFALPNLSGRLPVHMGTNPSTGTLYTIGQLAGVSTVTLTPQQIPIHNHPVIADGNVANTNQTLPTNNFYGTTAATQIYSAKTVGLQKMNTLPNQGGSQPHENMQPYLAVTFIISLFGIFPSPT
jgi:microcystin-dependent protein